MRKVLVNKFLTNNSDVSIRNNFSVNIDSLAGVLPGISGGHVRYHQLVAALVGAGADYGDTVGFRGAHDLFVVTVANKGNK